MRNKETLLFKSQSKTKTGSHIISFKSLKKKKNCESSGNIAQPCTATLHALPAKRGSQVLVKDKESIKQQQVHSSDI